MKVELRVASPWFIYAVCSHLIAASFPFVAAGLLKQLGVFSASSLFYAVGTGVILIVISINHTLRSELLEVGAMLAKGQWPSRLVFSLCCFAVAGAGYYLGLEQAEIKLEYIYITRLDFVLQVPVGILFFRERPNSQGLIGALIAAIGGAMIAYKGAFGASGFCWALLYVAMSLGAYTLISPVLKNQRSITPFAVLALRTVLLCLVFTTIVLACGPWLEHEAWLGHEGHTPSGLWTWITVLCAGLLLLGMFWLRFSALKGLQLWVFAALAPLQALGATVIALAMGERPSLVSFFGITLVVLGELLVALKSRTAVT